MARDGSSIPSFSWPPLPSIGEGQQQWPQWPPYHPGDGNGNNNFFGSWPAGFTIPNANRGGGGGLGAGTIILVAVLVTGFSLLALLLLRLWFCGCSQDDDARRRIDPGAADQAVANKLAVGLRRDVIESFQVVSYEALLAISRERSSSSLVCPVCLVEFGDEDEKIRVLPGCGHGFHTECIDMWLFSHTSCPVCRRDLGCGSIERRDDRVVIEMGQLIQHREHG